MSLVKVPLVRPGAFLSHRVLQKVYTRVFHRGATPGHECPVVYFSKKLLPREEKYATVEECLAIKLAIQHFRVYLLGRNFTVQRDHRCLEWLD